MVCTPIEAGVDTWRLSFATSVEGLQPGIFEAGRYRGQWQPGIGVLSLEGHPADEGQLAHGSALAGAYAEAVEMLLAAAHRRPIFRGVARLDSTVTLRFGDPRQGGLVLAGLAGLDWTGAEAAARPAVWPRSVTVMHPRGRRHLLRAYDKGEERGDVAAGSATPRELVRLEAQWRFKSGERPHVSHLDPAFIRNRFHRRFADLYRSTKGVTIAALPVIQRKLLNRLEAGEVTHREAERLAGFALLGKEAARFYPKFTLRDRRRELRDAGLVVADGLAEPVEVELAPVLEAALETPLWG